VALRSGQCPPLARHALRSGQLLRRFVPLLSLLLLFPLPVCAGLPISAISDFRTVFQPFRPPSGVLQVVLRRFVRDGVPQALLVNSLTLQTSVVPAASLDRLSPVALEALQTTPYGRVLERYGTPPVLLQNHGLQHALGDHEGVFLTVDLCPSRKPLERELFLALGKKAAREGKPVPVALCVSGRWLEGHGEELAWLRDQERAGSLAITWVNHSLTHPHDPALPLERNFLLTAGTDLPREILALEILLLERGLTPSPFFRFPGLVANGSAVAKLRELGLIPIGSDAWLAKGELPRDGSIVLIHGNGNEPPGVRRFLQLLAERPDLRLLPLPAAWAGGKP